VEKRTKLGADFLLGLLSFGASNQRRARLDLQRRASLAPAVGAEGIHAALERVAIPSEQVVAVGSVAGPDSC